MTKDEHIQYWQQQSVDDWETVDILLKGRKFLQALFWLHLSVEKLCKAVWINKADGNIPPRTHNLNRLMAETHIAVPQEFTILLVELNRFQLEGRYPDYVSDVSKSVNDALVEEYIDRSKPLKIWLTSLLPSRK